MTQDELWVGPHFPMNLFFLPEVFHLDFRIPRQTIVNVTRQPGERGDLTTIHFRHATGEKDSVTLQVVDVEGLRQALEL